MGAFRETDSAYHERYKHLRKRSMWKMDAREASSTLTRGELAEVEEITRGLSEELRLQDYDELFRELDVSPVVKLKILLSLRRRFLRLAEHEINKRISY